MNINRFRKFPALPVLPALPVRTASAPVARPVRRLACMLLTVLITTLATGGAAFATTYPDVSDEGLQRMDQDRFDVFYLADGATLGGFRQVLIGPVEVSFRKNWQRDQNSQRRGASDRITDEDMARIRGEVAAAFTEVFTQTFTDAGYEIVDAPVAGVLTLAPSIVELDVFAPDISRRQAGRTQTFTQSAGRMTLDLALFDAGSEQPLGRVIDERRGRQTEPLQWTTSISNRQEANLAFRAWARALVSELDAADAGS